MNKAEKLRQELLQYAETAQPNEFPIIFLLDMRLQKTSKAIETISPTEINAMYRTVYRLIGKDFSKYKDEEYYNMVGKYFDMMHNREDLRTNTGYTHYLQIPKLEV